MELVLDFGLVVSIQTVFNLKYNFHCPCRIYQYWKAVLIEQLNCANIIIVRYWYLIVCDCLLIWGLGKCDFSKQILQLSYLLTIDHHFENSKACIIL